MVLVLPNGEDFFTAFFGTQRSGGTAVPIYPDSGIERILRISELSETRYIVLPDSFPNQSIEKIKVLANSKTKIICKVGDSISHTSTKSFPEVMPEDLAYVQFTSGSTGNPKGVKMPHTNLVTNIQQMIDGFMLNENDVVVSWLPLYHDMGLILMALTPFYLGTKCVLLPTRPTNPRKWMEAIQDHKATLTAAPDFSYRLALMSLKHPERYNISSLRIALNAAESVRAKTVHDFEKAFRLKNVMMPAYGLAEATVGVSRWAPQTEVKIDDRGFVSVGKGFPEVEMKILANRKVAGPGTIGEILVKSPANTPGYFNNLLESNRLFWEEKYIHTGDLGYYDSEGDFFIVGRKKNLIIQAGQNISPQEVEEIVDELAFVRYSAAVGINRGYIEGEQVYIFAEVRKSPSSSQQEFQDLAVEIVRSFHNHMGFRPGRVYLLKPRAIPKTFNGKIKYFSLKEMYLKGSLHREGLVIFPDY